MWNRSDSKRRGFTLIEIAICLMLVTVAVLTVILVAINGIHAQNLVRYKIIAATKAMEFEELLRQHHPSMMNDGRDMDKEGIFPWDTRMCYKSMAPDMESAVECLRSTVRPLPEAIARRLDSDNDEIRSLIDQGGRIYYMFPNEPVGVLDTAPDIVRDKEWISNSNRILVGIVGYPQQNSILYHPSVKIGPYQDFVPSPPTHGRQENSYDWTTTTRQNRHNTGTSMTVSFDALCRDPDIAQVMISTTDTYDDSGAKKFGYLPFAGRGFSGTVYSSTTGKRPSDTDANIKIYRRRANAYLVAALWYANQAGITRQTLMNLDTVEEAEALAEAYSAAADWKKVLAMRYVAHAGSCLTSYFPGGIPAECWVDGVQTGGVPIGGIDGSTNGASSNGIDMTMGGIQFWVKASGAGFRYSLGNLRAWHECSVRQSILHADKAGPYHWGTSRPLNRQVMMDHPLVQLDIWSTPISGDFLFKTSTGTNDYPTPYTYSAPATYGSIVVNNVVTRRGWKACYPEAIQVPGVPRSFCGRHRDSDANGSVDPRDNACSTSGYYDYPARILDTNNDGILDSNDRPVPAAACAATDQPVLSGTVNTNGTLASPSAAWTNMRTDLTNNGQAAVGPASRFNLTAPFSPAQRCRQIVFWAVDWQSYSDFESCPSASIDASRYPIVAPYAVKGNNKNAATAWSAGFVQRSDYQRQLNVAHACGLIIPSGRNPELVSVFRIPSLVNASGYGDWDGFPRPGRIPTVGEINTWGAWDEADYFRGPATGGNSVGAQVPDIRGVNHGADDPSVGNVLNNSAANITRANLLLGHTGGISLWNNMVFLGMYGVNRNGQILEQALACTDPQNALYTGRGKPAVEVNAGPVPPSVRLRAMTVARFNFYDPRVSGSLRY